MINQNFTAEKSKNFAACHEQLCDIIKNFQQLIAIVLECFLFFGLTSVTFSFYEIYFAVKNDGKDKAQLGLCIISNIWNIFIIPGVILIFTQVHVTYNEGYLKTLKTLFKNFQTSRKTKEKRRILILILQLDNSTPNFSTGLYEINWKLCFFVS
ncbi:hypothetical protein PVAND_014498 [Polypedilum vanderplanki]|uniref:Gustatory receptor n=1 Tax=Polypedilum vanderplanki TaxID=319348 RepID=A0A9J6B9Y1_POLVA|nr:hypothetical protein PVAND_014498 [Polypedilum vanderplanki]